ncbi:MAG: hypothetical protein N2663_04595 [Chlorobi bacterium]|nr:hypothetical protein [Chlorobiota bacterium]
MRMKIYALVATTLLLPSVVGSTPIVFNRGFLESTDALFVGRIGSMRIYCRADGISIVGVRPSGDSIELERFDLDFPSGPSTVVPMKQRCEQYRVITGTTQRLLRAFDAIRYADVAPGVDVVLYWTPHRLKYDVIAQTPAALEHFQFVLRGARLSSSRHGNGSLDIFSPSEHFLDEAPIAVQLLPDGRTQHLSATYRITSDTTFGYRIVGNVDPSLPIVVDPAIVWSSYVGGSQEDAAGDVATDAAGNIYIAGNSLSIDFPLRGTSINRGRQNMIIAKFTADGRHLWSTYFGGERDEVAKAIVCNGSMLYVGGWSSSPSVILDPPQSNRAGGAFDAVVLAFTTDGTFVRGTFLGGNREELVNALALRRDGTLIAVGRTNSPDFPIAQAQQATLAGENDIFIVALSSQSLQIQWATYYGGTGFDEAYGVTTSPSGSVFVTGVTVSSDFPTANAFQTRAPALDNAFIIALNSAGRRIWASFLGGDDYDLANRIGYWNGKLFVVGTTSSENFPIVGDSIAQPTKSGYNDAFIACISEGGVPVWASFWGGRLAESGFSVVLLPDGRVAIAGSTSSPDFPRRRSILWTPRGNDDIFIALFRDGQNLWSTTFGGAGDDILYAAALLPNGDIIGTGETRSTDFEPLINPQYRASTTPSNRSDCFLFRLCTFTPSIATSSPNRVICAGQSIELWTRDSANITSIQWNTGNTTPRLTVTSPGRYWFTATSHSGCTVTSDTVLINAASTEPVRLDTIAPRRSLRICDGERIGLVVRGRYHSAVWLDNRGGLIASGDTLWVSVSGTFYAVVEDTNGCTIESLPHTVIVTPRPTLRYLWYDGRNWQPVARDTLHACIGDSIVVSIERPANGQCQWSDGSTECQRSITTDTRLVATVTDTSGCSWTMPSLTFRFDQRRTPLLTVADTVCTGSLVTARVENSSNTAVHWQLDSTLVVIAARTDSTELVVQPSIPGTYRLRVWLDSRCSDTLEKLVTILKTPNTRINVSQPWICRGQTVTLRAPAGFAGYRWNGQLGDSVITIADSGWYRLEVETEYGCTAHDSVFISFKESVTAQDTSIVFGTIDVGQAAFLPLTMVNPADTAALVMLTFSRSQPFTLNGQPQENAVIEPGAEYVATIQFSPSTDGNFTDTLIIEEVVPCRHTIRVVVRGSAIRQDRTIPIEVKVEDVTISPLDEKVHIRLYSWSSNPNAQRLDTLHVVLSYNPTMLLIRSIEPGTLVQLPARGRRGVISVTVPVNQLPMIPQTVPIATLSATVLLGNSEEDSIAIESIAASTFLEPTLSSGIVRYTGLCTRGGVRLLESTAVSVLMVIPNPNDGSEASVQLVAPDKGLWMVSIHGLDGRELWTRRVDARAGSTYSLMLPVLPAGVYIVRAQSPTGTAHAVLYLCRSGQ